MSVWCRQRMRVQYDGVNSWLSLFCFVGACGEICEGVLCEPWVGLCFDMGGYVYLIYLGECLQGYSWTFLGFLQRGLE